MKKAYCTYGSRTGLRFMDLRDFISDYAIELENYYGVDFGEDKRDVFQTFGRFDGGYQPCIICFVDEEDRRFFCINQQACSSQGRGKKETKDHTSVFISDAKKSDEQNP